MGIVRPKLKSKNITITLDHNPYEVSFYNSNSKSNQLVVFPICHFEGLRQYYDLIAPVINKGYRVVIINLLTKSDRLLFFNYYFQTFVRIINELKEVKFIKKDDEITLMGFGVCAYLCAYVSINHMILAKRMILISPVNNYRDEFQLSRNMNLIDIPTYIHFGQCDNFLIEIERYKLFETGHKNKLIHFHSYPICGHYLYYKDLLSTRLEAAYEENNYDMFIGRPNKHRTSPLPEISIENTEFFNKLFNELNGVVEKKKICLLTDVFPLFTNGVNIVVDLLRTELEKLGYEVYIAALWNQKLSYKELPDSHYIPIKASYATYLKGHRQLETLQTFKFAKHAKALALFGFDYLHLHTEYSMGQIALKLAKYTDIKLLYTYHTLWNLYYEQKFGRLIGDITFKAAKRLLFTKIYKSVDIITVPSKKSYDILKEEIKKEDNKDIRIIPSAINVSRFKIEKEDKEIIKELKKKYDLKDKKVLGYVGRVSLEKNIIETLEYISRVKKEIPNIVFMIVGVGDALAPLKKAVEKFDLVNNVIFIGEVDNSKLKYYYALFDVFVTASNFETQGLTYFESAASGTLLLAKQDRAIEDIFIDKENAYLYSTFEEWKERLELALFKNNDKIIKNAYKLMDRYASDKWSKQILSIYEELNPKETK